MKYAMIDGAAISSMADIHRTLAEQLAFPDWYGGNLDALHYCLTELTEETVIALIHADDLLESLGTAYTRLCRVLADSAEENPYLQIQS